MLTRPLTQPLTGPLVRGVGEGGGVSLPQIGTLVTVACGNSIAALSKIATDRWVWTGDLHVANTFAGAPMRFKAITPSTRTDAFGVYGYSGQELGTINGDIAAQWIAPLNTAGVTPDLVIGLALLENDITNGISVATMQARLTTWISTVQTAWPSARLLLCTPRPNASYNTGTLVANYQAMRDYVLSLANSRTIFTARLDAYEDAANPGTPLSGYTADGTHPNAKGAMVNARTIAATLRRIGRLVATDTITSANRTLTGSASATGTGVTGTKPTGCGTGGAANLTTVSTALNPGWRFTVNGTTGLAVSAPDCANGPADAVAGAPTYVSPYMVIRLGAGAENLRTLEMDPRVSDGGGNTFRLFLHLNSGDTDLDFVQGDVLTFLKPPVAANSGSITQVLNYITVQTKATTSSATFDVIEEGWMTVT